MGAGVGKGDVGAALAREVREQLDRVADVHHGDEGRIVLGGRQVADVKLGLALGLVHRGVPARRPTHGRPAPHLFRAADSVNASGSATLLLPCLASSTKQSRL